MRYLGIDYGTKRIGLAVSDPDGQLAFPYTTVGRLEDVTAIVSQQHIGAIVVGLPQSLGGTDTSTTRIVRTFAAQLAESVQLPIVFENEVFTTKVAEAHSPPKATDAAAAALILQSYLDKLTKS